MKFKKIVGFGDSWTHGDELLDPILAKTNPDAAHYWEENDPYRLKNCFIGRLGTHYDVPTENFGIPGGSMQSSIWTFLWWLEHEPDPENCLVIVGHTGSDRLSFYNPNHKHYSNDPVWNKFVHSTWIEYGSSVVPEDFRNLGKQHLVLTSCPELGRLNYIQTAMFFDGISARRSIPTLQFNVMPPDVENLDLPTMIWPGFSTTMWFRDHPNNRKRELVCQDGHPNEIGHQMIADKLISTIDSATM